MSTEIHAEDQNKCGSKAEARDFSTLGDGDSLLADSGLRHRAATDKAEAQE